METPVQIPTPDGKKIFGTLTHARPDKKPTEKLLIFVHGLGADSHRHIFYNGARYMAAQGTDVFRFDLHPGGQEGRFLLQTTIGTQTADLNLVLGHFRPMYSHIILAGHSLGGILAQKADQKLFEALILIACAAREVLEETSLITPHQNGYIANYGKQYPLSTAMVESMRAFPPVREAAKKMTKPMLVVCGSLDYFSKFAPLYHDQAASTQKSLKIIEGAGHMFNESETAQDLFMACNEFIQAL